MLVTSIFSFFHYVFKSYLSQNCQNLGFCGIGLNSPPFFSPGMVYIHGGFFCLQENGHIVAESNTGGGITVLKQSKGRFNDGQYHVVRYIRTGTNSTLQVDQLPMQTRMHSGKLNSHPDFNILNVSELIVLSENYLIL